LGINQSLEMVSVEKIHIFIYPDKLILLDIIIDFSRFFTYIYWANPSIKEGEFYLPTKGYIIIYD